MGQHADRDYEGFLNEALSSPVVSASPGYFFLSDAMSGGEPVLAWRIAAYGNATMVIPVMRFGHRGGYVLCPDSQVRHFGPSYGSELPDYPTLEAFRKDNIAFDSFAQAAFRRDASAPF